MAPRGGDGDDEVVDAGGGVPRDDDSVVRGALRARAAPLHLIAICVGCDDPSFTGQGVEDSPLFAQEPGGGAGAAVIEAHVNGDRGGAVIVQLGDRAGLA